MTIMSLFNRFFCINWCYRKTCHYNSHKWEW